MTLLVKNGLIQEKSKNKIVYKKRDILIRDNVIDTIAPWGEMNIECIETIDATNCIISPGMINSHMHSHDNLNKGYLDNYPLELWMTQIRPFYSGITYSEEELYFRTLIGAIEMVKSGTTTVIDDVLLNHIKDEKGLSIIVNAYRDIGMRAIVCPHTKNVPFVETIPYLKDRLSPATLEKCSQEIPHEQEILNFLENQIQQYNTPKSLVRIGLAPSAPHRCTIELLKGIKALSTKYAVPSVMHMLETKVQKKTGELFYGKSLIQYLSDHQLLYPNLLSIHSVWVTDDDIKTLQRNNCKVVHNPTCNMKMGSGIAPIKKLLDYNIPIGIGTDNMSANDTANLFEAMKNSALLSKIKTNNIDEWIDSDAAIRMSSDYGAACALLEDEIGSIEIGKKADLSIIELLNERHCSSINFSNSIVYSENGSSVRDVIINGQLVVKNNELCHFNEKMIYQKISLLKEVTKRNREIALDEGKEVLDIIRSIYKELS